MSMVCCWHAGISMCVATLQCLRERAVRVWRTCGGIRKKSAHARTAHPLNLVIFPDLKITSTLGTFTFLREFVREEQQRTELVLGAVQTRQAVVSLPKSQPTTTFPRRAPVSCYLPPRSESSPPSRLFTRIGSTAKDLGQICTRIITLVDVWGVTSALTGADG